MINYCSISKIISLTAKAVAVSEGYKFIYYLHNEWPNKKIYSKYSVNFWKWTYFSNLHAVSFNSIYDCCASIWVNSTSLHFWAVKENAVNILNCSLVLQHVWPCLYTFIFHPYIVRSYLIYDTVFSIFISNI